MEEDLNPKYEDRVDGWGFWWWDRWVGGWGPVGDSSIFGLVRKTGDFTVRCPTGPFPVSPVPALTGEVVHRYRV
jgi:hypothetical protein